MKLQRAVVDPQCEGGYDRRHEGSRDDRPHSAEEEAASQTYDKKVSFRRPSAWKPCGLARRCMPQAISATVVDSLPVRREGEGDRGEIPIHFSFLFICDVKALLEEEWRTDLLCYFLPNISRTGRNIGEGGSEREGRGVLIVTSECMHIRRTSEWTREKKEQVSQKSGWMDAFSLFSVLSLGSPASTSASLSSDIGLPSFLPSRFLALEP